MYPSNSPNETASGGMNMNALRNRRGQGTTEYILVVGIAVAIAVGILWKNLAGPNGELSKKVDEITSGISTVKVK